MSTTSEASPTGMSTLGRGRAVAFATARDDCFSPPATVLMPASVLNPIAKTILVLNRCMCVIQRNEWQMVMPLLPSMLAIGVQIDKQHRTGAGTKTPETRCQWTCLHSSKGTWPPGLQSRAVSTRCYTQIRESESLSQFVLVIFSGCVTVSIPLVNRPRGAAGKPARRWPTDARSVPQ